MGSNRQLNTILWNKGMAKKQQGKQEFIKPANNNISTYGVELWKIGHVLQEQKWISEDDFLEKPDQPE